VEKGYKSLIHGVIPKVKHATSFQNEVDFIIQYLNDIKKEGVSMNEICLVARTHDLLKQYEAAIKKIGSVEKEKEYFQNFI